MTKMKTTISVDGDKVEQVRQLTGASSTSAAIEVALDRLIRAERLRKDIAAYKSVLPSDEEIAIASITQDWSDLADDTDWDAVYSSDE